jgi:hypothetical protein
MKSSSPAVQPGEMVQITYTRPGAEVFGIVRGLREGFMTVKIILSFEEGKILGMPPETIRFENLDGNTYRDLIYDCKVTIVALTKRALKTRRKAA